MIQADVKNTEILFNKYDLRSSLENNRNQLTKEINTLAIPLEAEQKQIDELLADAVNKFKLELPQFQKEDIYTSSSEREVDVSQDFDLYISNRNEPFFKKYTVVTFHVPYKGEKEFFFMRASTFTFNPPRAEVTNEEIRVPFLISGEVSSEQLKSAFNNEIASIEKGLEWVNSDVGANYNNELLDLAKSLIEQRNKELVKTDELLNNLGFKTTPPQSKQASVETEQKPPKDLDVAGFEYDFFISHASEDKENIARPLYQALTGKYRVWFDEAELKLGDSLTKKIEEGLAKCKFGIVILSPTFFQKKWPEHELNALTARNIAQGGGVIIPVWHNITSEELLDHHPSLADLKAVSSQDGIESVTQQIIDSYNRSI